MVPWKALLWLTLLTRTSGQTQDGRVTCYQCENLDCFRSNSLRTCEGQFCIRRESRGIGSWQQRSWTNSFLN